MKKFLQFVSYNILKICVSFLLLFIPLYPKLPSIGISHVWVYIRLEDFFIAITFALFAVQVIRKKVKFPKSFMTVIGIYWLFGFISLLLSLVFIAPHLSNFYPSVAILSFARRIEYMGLFFVTFSTIRNKSDVKDYCIILFFALLGILLYGIGQREYLYFWQLFPAFFEKHSFCFPSFQTGNEEFAKGIPLCLPSDARITSTFGGHYDLAAYLVIVLPLLTGIFFSVKSKAIKIPSLLLFLGGLSLLIFTSSRQSFISYLVGVIASLIFLQRKKFILPAVVVSILFLLIFSGSTAKRFLETIRFTSIVTNEQGQVVGEANSSLPTSLQKKIAKSSVIVEAPPPTQNLPVGTIFSTLPQGHSTATNTAVIKQNISSQDAKKLKLANGGIELSTISGSFLIQKALVYDISLTTRLQGEWPNAWNAFLRDPPFGSGYATITLASDNDYLRFLGESGFLGLTSFLLIFLFIGIAIKSYSMQKSNGYANGFIMGLAGGIIGLFLNALLIDVFEASKVAETLWLLMGIMIGTIYISSKQAIPYKSYVRSVLLSKPLIFVYLFVAVLTIFLPSINNFFVGDDFTWLHWAAASSFSDLRSYFVNATSFFYRPIDKLLVFFLYSFLSFHPQGYHIIIIFIHFLMCSGVYLLGIRVTKNKVIGILGSVLYMTLAVHGENIFWFSTISTMLSSVLLLYGLISYIKGRTEGSKVPIIIAFILFFISLFTYEMAVIFPFLMLAVDLLLIRKNNKRFWLVYIPFIVCLPLYLLIRHVSHAEGFSGDYSYSIIHLIPNVIGNIFGYILLFTWGTQSIGFYEGFRDYFRTNVIVLVLFSGLVTIAAGSLLYKQKNKIKNISLGEKSGKKLFFLAITIIGLFPFLGLGNIAERYGYFSSVGFVLLVVSLLFDRIERYGKVKGKNGLKVILILVLLLTLYNFYGLRNEEKNWEKAGNITEDTLTYFRLNQVSIPPHSTFYIVNMPTRIGRSWIFPVGLTDGLWFIYRDSTLRVEKASTLEDARARAKTNKNNSYIFFFDKDYNISSVK